MLEVYAENHNIYNSCCLLASCNEWDMNISQTFGVLKPNIRIFLFYSTDVASHKFVTIIFILQRNHTVINYY